MRKVERYVDAVCDELHGACRYAENYIYYAKSHPDWSKMYHDMATQELTHAGYLYQIGDAMIADLKWVSEEDKECWEKLGKKMAEKTALVKLMLSK